MKKPRPRIPAASASSVTRARRARAASRHRSLAIVVASVVFLPGCGSGPADVAIAPPTSACGSSPDGGAATVNADGGGTPGTPPGVPGNAADGGSTADGSAPPTAGAASASYEAEDAFNAGTATFATSLPGFSGTGYVDAFGAAQARVVFAVNAASDGTTNVTLHYVNASATKTVGAWINGAKVADVVLASTAGAGFTAHTDTLTLRTGLNTIAYIDEDGTSNLVSVDRLEIGNGAPRPTRGAAVPFTEYEAEAGMTTGSIVGPGRDYLTVAAEASGRKAVTLSATGQYVEWTTSAPANALVVRYSMPDAATGGGTTGTLSLYVDGAKRQTLALSSKYAWVYGAYPYTNDPSQGSSHHYFDETPFLIGDVVPAGATVRVQSDPGDAPSVTVDLVDLEMAPAAYAAPSGALSITDFGATANDGTDDSPAMVSAIAAAKSQNKVLWVPAGSFDLHTRVDVDHVTIRGAGPWSSVFHGYSGKGGFNGTGDAVKLLDFAMFGDVTYRDDANFDAGVDGQLGTGSLVQNVWFEHTKVGVWFVGPTSGAYVVGCRIHDTFADGININGGATLSAAEHVHVRNTGDDAFAIWGSAAGTNGNRFKFDTARLPTLANGMAIYGGFDNSIEDGDIADTITASAGVAISTRFAQTPFGGTTQVLRTTVTRGGGHEPNWNTNFGALWVYADTQSLSTPIVIKDVDLIGSTYQGILVSYNQSITNVLFDRVTIDGAGSYGIEVDATGGATFNGVTVSGAVTAPSLIGAGFNVTKGAGDVGW